MMIKFFKKPIENLYIGDESGIPMNEPTRKLVSRLREEIADLKYENSKLEGELSCIKPVLSTAGVSPAVSIYCEDCKYCARSRWDGHPVGCFRDLTCDKFAKKEK